MEPPTAPSPDMRRNQSIVKRGEPVVSPSYKEGAVGVV